MQFAQAIAEGPPPPPFSGPASRGADAPIPPEILAQPVLVIEDETLIAWMLESLLEELGFAAIETAASVAEATAAASAIEPRLVISDINLGEGGNALDAVSQLCRGMPPRVLFVTAHADEAALARIAATVPHYEVLAKPVDSGAFRAALLRLIAGPMQQ